MAPRLYTVYTTISLLSQEGILPSLDYIGLEWFQINYIRSMTGDRFEVNPESWTQLKGSLQYLSLCFYVQTDSSHIYYWF